MLPSDDNKPNPEMYENNDDKASRKAKVDSLDSSTIQELQKDLHAFLVRHIGALGDLKTKCYTDATVRGSIHDQNEQAPYPPNVEAYTQGLKDFLDSHIRSITCLRDSLSFLKTSGSHEENFPSNSCPIAGDSEQTFEALRSQFDMLVIISTFTASLIISFISLVKSIVNDDHPIAFDVGMLLCFFAMCVHFGNILVAGRGSALASDHGGEGHTANDHTRTLTNGPIHDLPYFHHYLHLCEQLQFFATTIFLVAIAQLSFIVFHKLVYPLVLMGIAVLASVVVFWSAYWRVSMTFRNLMLLVRGVRGLRGRVRARSLSTSFTTRRATT